MFVSGDDLGDDDAFEVGGMGFDAFDFEAEHGEAFGEFIGGPVKVDELAEPVESDFHGVGEGGLELVEEAGIVFVEEPDVVDGVADHGDTFDSEAEGPAGPGFGVVSDVFEDLGVDHTAAGDFEPFLAHFTGECAAEIDFEAGFRVAEVVGAEADPDVFAEEFPEHEFDGALEVADRDVFIDVEAFDLLEGGVMGGVGVIASVDPAWDDDADRRGLAFHDADLD